MASREVLNISDEVLRSKNSEEMKSDCAGASTGANERVTVETMKNGVNNVVIREVTVPLAGGSSVLKMLLLVIFSCLLLSLPPSALPRNPGCIRKQLHPFCSIEDDVCPVNPIHNAYCADSSIHDYQILKPLGSGGFGSTWTATRWMTEKKYMSLRK